MSQIQNFADVNQVLAAYVPPLRQFREVYTLRTMQELMAALGNPQDSYKVIHVAGTSGKTSTAYFIASLLEQSGKKVGLTISPHVDKVSERVQINLQPLPDRLYFEELQTFIVLVTKTTSRPTYFELLVAFALWEFARQKVDYAVVEVGLGGLLDATNIFTRPDKISVITDIGLDHVDILGNDIIEIARQKAGIVLPHSHLFHLSQTPEVDAVFAKVAQHAQAQVHSYTYSDTEQAKQLPLFQQRNWYLADKVSGFVLRRDGLDALTTQQLIRSTHVYIPARMEVIKNQKNTLVIDAAHNPQKMQALVRSLRALYPGEKFAVLLALLQSKDARLEGVLAELLPITSHLIVTDFIAGQDLRKHATDPQKIVAACADFGFTSAEIIQNKRAAFDALQARPETYRLVTGSFYLLQDIHNEVEANR